MRCLGNRVQGWLSVCASVCWLIRWCGIKGRWGRSIACRACVNSRVYMSDEVAVLKGDLTGQLCKWWLMGSLESLFSQSNEVHLPGGEEYEGQALRLRRTARSPHSTLRREERWTRWLSCNDSLCLPWRRLQGQPELAAFDRMSGSGHPFCSLLSLCLATNYVSKVLDVSKSGELWSRDIGPLQIKGNISVGPMNTKV